MLMRFVKKATAIVAGLLIATSVFAGMHSTSNQTIASIVKTNPNFSTLRTALQKAGLVRVLNGRGPFTVFAPTNAAFAQLPQGALQKLLNNRRQLRKVLLYHVVKGRVTAAQIHPGTVKTVEGQSVKLTLTQRGRMPAVYVNQALVKKADIMASNGVIHVINKVLLPPARHSRY